MSKLSLGVRLVCASFLGFMGGALMMSKYQEQETQKAKEELVKVIKELQNTKKLLETKDKEISIKIEEALENERETRVDDLLKLTKMIKSFEEKLKAYEKTDKAIP